MADVEFNDLLLQQLREDGLIVPDQANEVVDEHERTGKPVRQVLIDMDIIAEDQLLEVIARQLGTQVINLRDLELQPEVIKTIPASVARMYNVIPVEVGKNSVTLATFDLSPEVLDAVSAGPIAFAVDQQPYLQGYLPVVFLELAVRNRNEVGAGQMVATGPSLVTKDNAAAIAALSEQGTR